MDDLVESILDYVRSDYTDYAIMINGEWGSGKTYFWNNKIRNRIENMTINGKKITTIYMSLYGISNLEEISKKIFIETTQLMDKNLKKYMNSNGQSQIPEYAKTGLDMANLFGVTQNGDKLDYSEFFSTEDKVLCFDDLERANVDVIDILGYINNFVEHDHIKTIIICNEKELSTKLKSGNLEMKTFIATYLLDKEKKLLTNDKPMVEKIKDTIEDVFDKANDYERIKEKLVGETFEYIPEFTYIINGILIRYEKYPELIRFLRENTDLIISTFNKSGTTNLRILKHALSDFKKVYDVIQRYYPNINYRILQTMLIFTIAISFEIKAGKVVKDKFIAIGSNEEYKTILLTSKIFMDNRQFYIKEFDNNYYYNFKADYRFFKFIELFVRTRIFDMKIFKKDIEDIINTIDTKNLPGHKRLLTEEYWKISDDEFGNVIKEVIDSVRDGNVKLIDMVKIYAYFVYFIKKDLINYDLNVLKSIFLNGMNISSLSSKYCESYEEELAGIYVENNSSEMDEIIERFKELNYQLKDREFNELAESVFKNIPMKMEVFYDKFEEECMDVPIFKYADSYQLFQRLSNASNEDIVIIKDKISARYDKNKEVFIPELKNLKGLKHYIREYIDDKPTSIKTVVLEDFEKMLENILNENKEKITEEENVLITDEIDFKFKEIEELRKKILDDLESGNN